MAHTVAITNQKGGVGKTTTAVNLAAAIAVAERRTLLVDADPQGNTTSGVGIAKLELQVSLYDVLVDGHSVQDVILPVPGLPYLSVLPATQDLVGAELQLVERPFRESALRRVLEPIARDYDYIIVDCPPSLGLLTLNVLAAVQAVIIPIQCEYYGLEGISQLLNTVRLVQQNINPSLAIGGVLLTMYDSRLNLCRQVAEDATEYFGSKVFGTPIPRNVRLAEAPSFGKPILLYDVHSVGAKSYLAVGQELLRRVEGADSAVMPMSGALSAERAASVELPELADSRSAESQAVETHVGDGAGEWQGAEAQVAEPEISESQVAETQVGETQVSETQVGETPVGESQVPESQVPESQAPESQAPESQAPESQAPESQISESQTLRSQVAESPIDEPQIAPRVAQPRVAEPQVAERRGADSLAAEAPGGAPQGTESQPPESHTAGPQSAESEAAEPVAEVLAMAPQPGDDDSVASQPVDAESTSPPQSMPRAESPDFDESTEPSKPPSQHLPEVTT